ncbi:hypothetical protein GS597_13740 [Synechococcales cyanobacterium C]|uniref:Uncharacterized protein n=1 Tax=Petrachloros mirabilis ULC683 TaxID=2781853 RepID=A0A8K2A184_9CYAN|nr:hypothetical protein [Petrachloros mirabilis]NCJ07552.1 hypothetical protein [Petrachloros mirabilis ULC683]
MVSQRRCDRNRKRSKRRAIFCPIHNCHLDSASQKFALYADQPGQLQSRGIGRRPALLLIQTMTAVPLTGEWLELFWCEQCQETTWYHVHRHEDRTYSISPAPIELWQQATGVINPNGNPSVGEFTRRQARQVKWQGIKDFRNLG